MEFCDINSTINYLILITTPLTGDILEKNQSTLGNCQKFLFGSSLTGKINSMCKSFSHN